MKQRPSLRAVPEHAQPQPQEILAAVIRQHGRIRVTPEELAALEGKHLAFEGRQDAGGALVLEVHVLDQPPAPGVQVQRESPITIPMPRLKGPLHV